jgi:hypothetical protein
VCSIAQKDQASFPHKADEFLPVRGDDPKFESDRNRTLIRLRRVGELGQNVRDRGRIKIQSPREVD